ncbi:MAG TPA: PASTA domain-containing protein [Candidatus Acidoferrales bacterium]|nr:PASTA domain-containing protein [Candidatus Acidoferrales bacterium]
MPLRESLQFWARVSLRIFILMAVAFLSMLAAIRLTIHGRDVKVPDLTRLRAGDAQQLLDARGLGIRIEDRIFSALPRDAVIRQRPIAGETVRVGQRVHVVISLGSQALPIPELVGESQRAARIGLLEAGMQLGHISSTHLQDSDPDTVVDQDPPSTEKSTHSPRMDLLVSLGPPDAAYVMPDLTGLMPVDAQRRLNAAGLVLGKFLTIPAPPEKRGTVVGQSVPRGSRVLSGTIVDVRLGG